MVNDLSPTRPGVPARSPLVRKLQTFADLSPGDIGVIDALTANPRNRRAGEDLIREGDKPEHVFMLIEGWAYRYKVLASGRRQILALLLPGDVCDIHIFVLKSMDHGIALLDDAKVVAVPAADMLALMADNPAIERALWWATLVDEAVLREWLTSMGQRDALARLAHLLSELWMRMDTVGLIADECFSMPLTQTDLADALGLTPVHVNRLLQKLRALDFITLERKRLTIHDVRGLMRLSHFDPNYLHLDFDTAAPQRWRSGAIKDEIRAAIQHR